MRLAKCPICGAKQKFNKIMFLTHIGSRVCDNCQVRYEMVKSKVSYLTLVVVAPFIFFPIFMKFDYYFYFSLTWVIVGLFFLLKYMPLRVCGTDK